jgi:hypothetical protein
MCFSFAMAEDAAPALTDNALDGIVELDGVIYQLPFPAQLLVDNGWEFSLPSTQEGMIKNEQIISTRVKKGKIEPSIKIANVSGADMPYEEALVVSITFYSVDSTLKDMPNFVRFSNVVSNSCTLKDVEKAQGKADVKNGGGLFDGGDAYVQYKGEDSKYFNVGHNFFMRFKGGAVSEMSINYMLNDFAH